MMLRFCTSLLLVLLPLAFVANSQQAKQDQISGQTISTKSQRIVTGEKATLTLPDGSSVSIPPNALRSDKVVTLSKLSALPTPLQPPNEQIRSSGPALTVSFGVPNPQTRMIAAKPSLVGVALRTSDTNKPVLGFFMGLSPQQVIDLQDAAAMAVITDASGDHFIGVQEVFDASKSGVSVAVPILDFNTIVSISIAMVDWIKGEPPPNGGRLWNGSQWAPFTCQPGARVLVLVHGMMSGVDKAYGGVADIKSAGWYDQVAGFNYDWTQDIHQSGAQLADFLNEVAKCSGQVDIEAHSEGVPVTLSAVKQVKPPITIGTFIALGGPIMGTPVASSPWADLTVLTVLLNMPGVRVLTSGQRLHHTLTRPFLEGLKVDSAIGKVPLENCCGVALTDTKYLLVAGTHHPDLNIPLGTYIDSYIAALFPNVPYDGIIGEDSALAKSSIAFSDKKNLSLKSFDLPHTGLPGNCSVIKYVGESVKPAGSLAAILHCEPGPPTSLMPLSNED